MSAVQVKTAVSDLDVDTPFIISGEKQALLWHKSYHPKQRRPDDKVQQWVSTLQEGKLLHKVFAG